MKSKLLILFLMFGTLGLGGLSSAELAQVELSKGSLIVPERRVRETRDSWMEFGASTWFPKNFSLPTKVGADVTFGRSTLPSAYLDFILQGNHERTFNFRLGANFLRMSRSAPTQSGASFVTESQTADLLSLRLGAEYLPKALRSKAMETYLTGDLLPSVLVASPSAFGVGASYAALPLEVGAGARMRLSSVGLQFQDAELDLGVTEILGTLESSSLAGFGAKMGLKVSL